MLIEEGYINTFRLLAAILLIMFLLYLIQGKLLTFYNIYKMTKIVPLCEEIPYSTILGHATLFVDLEKLLVTVRKASQVPSPPRIFRLGHIMYFMITRPEDLEVVLNSQSCLSKHEVYEFTVAQQGSGLFNLPAQPWKKHRKVIRPAFNQKVLDSFVEVFSQTAEICAIELKKANGKLVDIFTYINKLSIDSICETSMGYELHAQTGDSKLLRAIQKGLEISMLRMFNILYHNDFIFNLTKSSKVFYESTQFYQDFINTILEKKKQAYQNRMKNGKDASNCNGNQRKPFLDILIELTFGDDSGENWSNEELLGEVCNFIVAGTDTTSTTVAFTIILLAMHQEIQEKCFQEVMAVIGLDREVTYEDLPKLVYLDKVIKESLRLFPVGPVIMRRIEKDMEVGGYTLPKGAGIMISIVGVHYAEKYYNDPYKFDPERFTPEEIAKRHKYSHIPFSKGPRNCIGMVYGIMNVKTILSVLLRNFRFETTYDDIRKIRLQQSLIVKPIEGFPVNAIPRQ